MEVTINKVCRAVTPSSFRPVLDVHLKVRFELEILNSCTTDAEIEKQFYATFKESLNKYLMAQKL